MKIQSKWVIKYRKKCSKTYIYAGNFSNYHLILCYRHALLLIHEKIKSFVLIIRVFQREMVCHLKIGEPILQLYCLTTTQRYYIPTIELLFRWTFFKQFLLLRSDILCRIASSLRIRKNFFDLPWFKLLRQLFLFHKIQIKMNKKIKKFWLCWG